MRRWIVYALVMALVLLISPVPKNDVGELKPVELLYVHYGDAGKLWVETDTGDRGMGETLEEALGDLKATASGVIFLDTADYLILHKNAAFLLPQLWKVLRPATQVCLGNGIGEDTPAFLAAHKPGVTLNDIRSGAWAMPTLTRIEERYRLEYESGF